MAVIEQYNTAVSDDLSDNLVYEHVNPSPLTYKIKFKLFGGAWDALYQLSPAPFLGGEGFLITCCSPSPLAIWPFGNANLSPTSTRRIAHSSEGGTNSRPSSDSCYGQLQ